MSEVKVESNADGLGVAKGMPVLATVDVGDYQGQTIVLLDDDKNDTVHLYDIEYGSCGGCDWFENFYGDPISYKDCLENFQDYQPRYIYPKQEFRNKKPEDLFLLLLDPDGGYQDMIPEYGWTKEAAKTLIESVK